MRSAGAVGDPTAPAAAPIQEGVHQMSESVRRVFRRSSDENPAGTMLNVGDVATGSSLPEARKRDPHGRSREPQAMNDPSEYVRLGKHVAAVMKSAEEAAASMTQEARLEAEQLRDNARRESEAALEAAKRKADALVSETEQLRIQTETQARATQAE